MREIVFSMKMKRYAAVFLLALPAIAFAQNAANDLDALLAADTVTAADAARFALEAADLLPWGLTGAEAEKAAWETASSKGWIKKARGEALTLKDTAFLVMKAFNLKGGVMYSLFKSPRYAYREMVYQRLISGAADPAMPVTGSKFLQILGATLHYTGRGVK